MFHARLQEAGPNTTGAMFDFIQQSVQLLQHGECSSTVDTAPFVVKIHQVRSKLINKGSEWGALGNV
jgi:hypothetical protein